MLATFGLDRLEAGLDTDTISAEDVAAVLEQAKADCAKTPILAELDLEDDFDPRFDEYLATKPVPGLPARIYVHHGGNPEFRPTRQPDRV
jgi:fermentation-respiration switch protein FrsA (DUF1100 family)